jgi:iron complex transport system ATP-binding protein
MNALEVHQLGIRLGRQEIVSDVSLKVAAGKMVGLIGPNGSGKSTLLRAVYRVLRPNAGSIDLHGENLWSIAHRESARRVGAVCQESSVTHDVTVLELVQLGRFPHQAWFQPNSSDDQQIVWKAIEQMGLTTQAHSPLSRLSGGERQRALIARGLAQQPQLLVLDEPTNHLDIRHQIEIMSLIQKLPIAKLITLHDLNLAAEYCDEVYLLAAGRVVASGLPSEVLTPQLIQQVYQVRAVQGTNPVSHRPMLHFSHNSETANAFKST